jgi:hypothetical protein
MEYANGDRFVGNFEGGLRGGEGEMVCVDGTGYKGGWKGDKMHGEG